MNDSESQPSPLEQRWEEWKHCLEQMTEPITRHYVFAKYVLRMGKWDAMKCAALGNGGMPTMGELEYIAERWD